ncbi:hypothetical protein ACS0TY_010982 [Phlomoides rotata]
MGRWKREFNVDGNMSLKNLQDVLLNLVDGGEDFKRLFVLFSLSSFLTSSANRLINCKTIKFVLEVDKIRDFDWSSYVLKCLCKAIAKFNSLGMVKNCSGCVFILPILYFHIMKWQRVAESSSLPSIQHWIESKLRKRFKEENLDGGFGNGVFINDLYLISNNQPEKQSPEKVVEPDFGDNDSADEQCNEDNTLYIKFKLPKN